MRQNDAGPTVETVIDPEPSQPGTLVLRGTTVSVGTAAVLIRGAAGAGKSSLGLQMMALGAGLVADDYTDAQVIDGALRVAAPRATRGLIEARGVGILTADPTGPAWLHLVVDLDQIEDGRLPPERFCSIADVRIPLVHKVASAHFPAAILQYLKSGRRA